MLWPSRISVHSTFATGMLGPEMVLGAGLGILSVVIFLVGLTKVGDADTGAASSLVNVGQQAGGAIGLAVVGTVAWSGVASSLRSAAAGAQAGLHARALAAGFDRGYLVAAGVLALALIVALAVIRVRRQDDLSGAGPAPEVP